MGDGGEGFGEGGGKGYLDLVPLNGDALAQLAEAIQSLRSTHRLEVSIPRSQHRVCTRAHRPTATASAHAPLHAGGKTWPGPLPALPRSLPLPSLTHRQNERARAPMHVKVTHARARAPHPHTRKRNAAPRGLPPPPSRLSPFLTHSKARPSSPLQSVPRARAPTPTPTPRRPGRVQTDVCLVMHGQFKRPANPRNPTTHPPTQTRTHRYQKRGAKGASVYKHASDSDDALAHSLAPPPSV